jgi:expansin (peptidoglycan-binding protein)
MGGALPTGGMDTGGAFPTGGTNTGGSTGGTDTGGAFPTGGTNTGGTATGGTATGGTATGGKGGMATGGSAMGGSATGGTGNVAGATSCNIGDAHNGNGSFTWYNFAQGTYQENGQYVTACGYRGTANGTADTVQNISNTSPASNQYFVAIPSNSNTDFNTSQYCGACVELTGQNGTKIVATVIDSCPRTGPVQNPRCTDGHLDVSKTAFDRLGFSRGDPSNTTWRFVPCPVGNMKVNTRMKSGNNNEFFVEGGITAVTSVSVNGTMATRTSYGAWHINSAVPGGAMLTLTDRGGNGRASLTVPLNSGSTSNQDSGKQFQGCN